MAPKRKRNAFACFLADFRDDEEKKGRKLPKTKREVIVLAGLKWGELSEVEKQRYKDEAKANRKNTDRLDCTGRSIAEVEKEDEEYEQRQPRMLSFVENHLNRLGSIEEVIAESFYVISFNIFCETRQKHYLAAEVGLVEYSVESGITKQFQSFIDPGPIPLGYTSVCRQLSENTHQIPLRGRDEEGEEIVRQNGTNVMTRIIDFIDSDRNLDKDPTIYCKTEELYQTQFILEHLQLGSKRRMYFTVIDLACLFLKLFQKAAPDVLISIGIVRDLLRGTAFAFNANSCCDWHWEKDCAEYCALSVVKRSCFVMSQRICKEYDIVPIANHHFP